MQNTSIHKLWLWLVPLLLFTTNVPEALAAQKGDGLIEPGEDEIAELARAAQNPVASMISLPFQSNTDFNFGPLDKTQSVLNVQPVIPFDVNDNWNLITRTIVPIVSMPGLIPGQERETGIGDTVFTAFLSPKKSGKWIWGAGAAALIPTNTDTRLGPDEWGLGPSVVALTMPGKWVVGGIANNIWSVGEESGNKVNLMTIQPFVNYNMDGGWFLAFAPIITANWEAPDNQQWTVPLGGGFGRIFRIGKQPINASIQYYYNVEKPDFVGDTNLRLVWQFMFPK
jgi:hypothetical protein